MPKSNELTKQKLCTQKEVAEHFRVVPGTIKNWRDRGLLSYCQVPGSTRVFYYRDEVIKLRVNNTVSKKGGDRQKPKIRVPKGNPVISENDKDWRI